MTIEVAVAAFFAKKAKEYAERRARKWAEADAKDRGEWRGSAKYRIATKAEIAEFRYPASGPDTYLVELDPSDPMRFYSYETELEYRTAMRYVCDFGSIPKLADVALGGELLKLDPLDFWRSYGLHDDFYNSGGVWVRDPSGASGWTFVSLDRVHGDILLLWGLSAEAANNATLQAVYRSVRLGAGIPWRRHRKRDEGGA